MSSKFATLSNKIKELAKVGVENEGELKETSPSNDIKSHKIPPNSHRQTERFPMNQKENSKSLFENLQGGSDRPQREVKDDTSKFGRKAAWFDTNTNFTKNVNYWSKLKDSLFESINKRFHIKEKVKKAELPKVFPLESFRIGRSGSYFHLDEQLFVIIEKQKYVFVVVYPNIPDKDEFKSPYSGTLFGINLNFDYQSLYHRSKRTLKNTLFLSNHLSLESQDDSPGYFGAISYEIYYNELHGMEFTNSLLNDSCRIVTECKDLHKKSFKNVVDLLKYYDIEYFLEDELPKSHNKIYQPILTKDMDKNITVKLKRQFPKEPLSEARQPDTPTDMHAEARTDRDLKTEPASSEISEAMEEIKVTKADSDSKTPEKAQRFGSKFRLHSEQVTLDDRQVKLCLSDCRRNRVNIIEDLDETISNPISDSNQDDMMLSSNKAEIKSKIYKNSLLLSQRTIKNVTVQGYFDDPLLPYRMREVIMMKENKQLLLHYETSLPSWAVVMATYAFYQPWFRKFQYWFMIVLSLITMMVGCFDLYKNIPYFRDFLKVYLSSIWDWLEEHVFFRIICVFGYLLTESSLAINLAIYIMQIPLLGRICYLFEYLMLFVSLIVRPLALSKVIFHAIVFCFIEAFYPVYYLISMFTSMVYSIVKFNLGVIRFIILLPQAPILTIWYTIKYVFQCIFSVFNTFKGFFRSIRNINYTQAEVANTTTVFYAAFTKIKDIFLQWAQSIIVKGVKAIYHTLVHIGSEIGKYRYSILRYIYGGILRLIPLLERLIVWMLYSDFKYVLICMSYLMVSWVSYRFLCIYIQIMFLNEDLNPDYSSINDL